MVGGEYWSRAANLIGVPEVGVFWDPPLDGEARSLDEPLETKVFFFVEEPSTNVEHCWKGDVCTEKGDLFSHASVEVNGSAETGSLSLRNKFIFSSFTLICFQLFLKCLNK